MGCSDSKVTSLKMPTDAEMNKLYQRRKSRYDKAMENKRKRKEFLVKRKKKTKGEEEYQKKINSKTGKFLSKKRVLISGKKSSFTSRRKMNKCFLPPIQNFNSNLNGGRKTQTGEILTTTKKTELCCQSNENYPHDTSPKIFNITLNMNEECISPKKFKKFKIDPNMKNCRVNHEFSSTKVLQINSFKIRGEEKSWRKKSSESENLKILPFSLMKRKKKQNSAKQFKKRVRFDSLNKSNYNTVKKSLFKKAKEDKEFLKELSQINLLEGLDESPIRRLNSFQDLDDDSERFSERDMILPKKFDSLEQKSVLEF